MTRLFSVSSPWERIRGFFENPENLLFVALLVAHVAPVWLFPFFPSHDGPAHLNTAVILREYSRSPLLQEHYVFVAGPASAWLAHLVMAVLMSAVSPLIAEKIFVTGCVILLPLAMRYALSAIHSGAKFLACLVFPFATGWFLHQGFYSFAMSLPVFCLVLGYWIRHQDRMATTKAVMLSGWLLLLWLAHIVSLIMAAVAIAGLTTCRWVDLLGRPASASGTVAAFRQFRHDVVRVFLAFLPSLALLVIYLMPGLDRLPPLAPAMLIVPATLLVLGGIACLWLGALRLLVHRLAPIGRRALLVTAVLMFLTAAVVPTVTPSGMSAGRRWMTLICLNAVASYDDREQVAAIALAALFAGMTLYQIRRRLAGLSSPAPSAFLPLAGVFAFMTLVSPDGMAGGGFVVVRLSAFPYLILLLWFGLSQWSRTGKLVVQGCAAAIALTLVGYHIRQYQDLNPILQEYLSGRHLVAPGATLVSYSTRDAIRDRLVGSSSLAPERGRIDVARSTAGYIGALGNVVFLTNYHLRSRGFPFRLRAQSNREVDYVLLWKVPAGVMTRGGPHGVFEQFPARYELIFTSPRWGYMKLYRRKGLAPQ